VPFDRNPITESLILTMEHKIVAAPRSRVQRPVELPSAFAHLQPFTGWSLATETERNTRRHEASMDEIQAFIDAMLADVDAIVAYLDAFGETLPPEARALMDMLMSLAEVAPVVECYRQQAVIDGYDPRRFVADENFVLKPAL
jgi:hypothetical protein